MHTKLEIKRTNEDLTVYPVEREITASRIIAVGDLHVKIKQFSSTLIQGWYNAQLYYHEPIEMSQYGHPVMKVLWNRQPNGPLPNNIINVHGHTGPDKHFSNSINTDSDWGKPEEPKHAENSYGQLVETGDVFPAANQDVCDIICQSADSSHKIGDYYTSAVFMEPAYAVAATSAASCSTQEKGVDDNEIEVAQLISAKEKQSNVELTWNTFCQSADEFYKLDFSHF